MNIKYHECDRCSMYGYTNIALGKEMHYMYRYTHIYMYHGDWSTRLHSSLDLRVATSLVVFPVTVGVMVDVPAIPLWCGGESLYMTGVLFFSVCGAYVVFIQYAKCSSPQIGKITQHGFRKYLIRLSVPARLCWC